MFKLPKCYIKIDEEWVGICPWWADPVCWVVVVVVLIAVMVSYVVTF